MTDDDIIALRKTTRATTFEPFADTIAFARAIESAVSAERDAAREDARRYRAALRRVFFLEHNEREWNTLEECQAYARRECAAIDAARRLLARRNDAPTTTGGVE